jgi:esterase/lipase superfamily enzyme
MLVTQSGYFRGCMSKAGQRWLTGEHVHLSPPSTRRLGMIIGALVLIIACLGSPASAKEKKQAVVSDATKYVQLPVLYLTDRQIQGETYGPRRRYPIHCLHHMYYGTANVIVANRHHLTQQQLDALHLGWKGVDTKPLKISTKDRIDPSNPPQSKAAFLDRIKSSLDQSGQEDLCVYVHGAESAFEDAMLDAADLEYSMQLPLVLYSWPSDPKMRGYFIDGSNNEWSQGHFDTFCKDLIAFRAQHPCKVILISHSMGNRLVIRAIPVNFGTGLIKECELVSPDMDADTCRHYAMGFSEGPAKIRLFVSNKDKMLPIAQMLAGGYYRLGEAANPVSIPEQWKTTVNPGLIERIDFTSIDKGFRGHSMPDDLVSNIARNNTAGPGLKLVPESEVRGSRLVKFADKSDRLSAENSGLPVQFCKRVLPDK